MDEQNKNPEENQKVPMTAAQLEEKFFRNVQCNMTAVMYLVTEQQAIIGRLLQELTARGVLTSNGLEHVTDIYGNEELLRPIYDDLFKRYVFYFKNTFDYIKEKDGLNGPKKPE